MLNAILTSPNQVNSYNPVIEYFDSLKNSWDGKDHIDRLCDFLKAHDFDDKEEPDYYQKRLNRLVKKWIVSTVACVYGIRPNDAMLGFVNAEGDIGKTTLIQSFVPKCLEEYYIASDKESKMFRISPSFAMKFIINFDEFVCLTKATENEFKSNMSRLKMDIKRQGENFFSQVPRIASCMFTSEKTQEKGGFLFTSDSGFLRRIATIELEEILKEYKEEIDFDQVWAQAVALYLSSSFEYGFDSQDHKDFQEYNLRYVIETSIDKLIRTWYRKLEKGEEGIFR